jgi:hypothetical protein
MKFTATIQSMSGIETIRIGGEFYREFHKMPHTGDILCISRDGERGQGRIVETLHIDQTTYDLVRAAALQYIDAQRALSALTLPVVRAEAAARKEEVA